MRLAKCIAFVCIFCVLLINCGCFGPANNRAGDSSSAYTVTDSQGTIVKLPQKPQRIVGLSVGTDEILLGLVAPERIAALTHLVDDPGISNAAAQAKTVSKKIKATPEVLIGLQPDLVLAPDWLQGDLIRITRDAGIPIYVYKTPDTVDQVRQMIQELAGVVGEPEQGKLLLARMEEKLAGVEEKLAQIPETEQPVIVQYTVMGGSGGIGSTFDNLCRYARVKNGAALAGLKANEVLSQEQIVKINPDILLLPAWDYENKTDFQKFKQDIQNDPALQSLKAVRQKRLVQLPDRYLFSSSQYIADSVEELAKTAYPQYFR